MVGAFSCLGQEDGALKVRAIPSGDRAADWRAHINQRSVGVGVRTTGNGCSTAESLSFLFAQPWYFHFENDPLRGLVFFSFY